jgi:ComF family protein
VNLLADFVALFYPQVCAACGGELLQGEEHICINCILSLPYTGFAQQNPNPTQQAFWGRIELQTATSFLYFRQGNRTQKMMHRIKYKGDKELAQYIGGLMGDELKSTKLFEEVDCIIPVPMHKAKQRKRGFNQSEWFAKGLAQKLNIPVITDVLLKTTATQSQTRKSRWQRWLNAGERYAVQNPASIAGKNILLVDDILTTGATLEACGQTLQTATNCTLSIATMAITQ